MSIREVMVRRSVFPSGDRETVFVVRMRVRCAGFGAVAALAVWLCATPATGAPPPGKGNCQDLSFTKWVDKTSSVLFFDCASGKHGGRVHLTAYDEEVEAALAKDGVAHPEIEVLWQAKGPPGATIPRSGTGPTFSFETIS